jgi:porphobilinogen deaminase
MGSFAVIEDNKMNVTGVVIAPDGSRLIREQVEGDYTKPHALGREAGERLIARGALEMIGPALSGQRDNEV